MPTEPANTVETRLATLAAMLRLLTADQPFQPILAASVDLTAWQAIFTNECIRLLDDAKRQLPAPTTIKPFEELRDFTAELFAAAYFARFQANAYPDREPGEFILDDDCPRTSPFLNEPTPDNPAAAEIERCAAKATELRAWLERELSAARNRLRRASNSLQKALDGSGVLDALDNNQPPAPDDFGFEGTTTATDFARLLNVPATPAKNKQHPQTEPTHTQDRDIERFWKIRCYIQSTLLPRLQEALKVVIPGLEHSIRGQRRTPKIKIDNTASSWLSAFESIRGWQHLHTALHYVTTLEHLLTACREASCQSESAQDGDSQPEAIFTSLARLPLDVIHPVLRGTWQESLRDADCKHIASQVLPKLAQGASSVTPSSLERLQKQSAAKSSDEADAKHIKRTLQKLANDGLAVRAPQTWVSQPRPAPAGTNSPPESTVKARRTNEWVINPLLILLLPLGDAN